MFGEGLGVVAADNRVGSVRSGTIQSYPCRLIGGEQTAGRSRCSVVNLTSRDNEAQRAAQRIGQHMDLGRQTTSRTSQRLIFGPPISLVAC